MKNHTKESKSRKITYKQYQWALKYADKEIKEWQRFTRDLKKAYRHQHLLKNVL